MQDEEQWEALKNMTKAGVDIDNIIRLTEELLALLPIPISSLKKYYGITIDYLESTWDKKEY